MAECVCNEIFDDGADITRDDGQPTYRGRAKPGVGTGESEWQIVKYIYSDGGAGDEVVKIVYADGNPSFVHEYDLRDGYDYTLAGP